MDKLGGGGGVGGEMSATSVLISSVRRYDFLTGIKVNSLLSGLWRFTEKSENI